nr:probable serine/threonine-protein kinase PBL25 [Quercus suber]
MEAYEGIRNTRYCTPEFRASGKVTEKTDVYKFGGLLLELFIGKDSDVITQLPVYKILVAYPAQGSCINEIVDPAITADGKESASLQRQLQAVLYLVLICTKEDPQRRPSMVDVTKELGQIERSVNGETVKEARVRRKRSEIHESEAARGRSTGAWRRSQIPIQRVEARA